MGRIAVIDFGGQYTQLIARRVRELSVYSEILPADTPASALSCYDGIILAGGPASVYDKGAPHCDPDIFEMGKPVLGICYGMQLMAHRYGGRVSPAEIREYGDTSVQVKKRSGLFSGMDDLESVWMSHGDSVLSSGIGGFEPLAVTDGGILAAMGNAGKGLYGVQFHPEVRDTPKGMAVLGNFVLGICNATQDWTMEDYVKTSTGQISRQVGNGHALSLISGGVDSAVATSLVYRAIGPSQHCLYVDTGLMRLNESKDVENALRSAGVNNLHVSDWSDYFLERLAGVRDPQQKRQIIGDAFVHVLEKEMRRLGLPDDSYVVQGTLYPDRIESGIGTADLIKTHHNWGPMEERRKRGLVVEPLASLFKDEVRSVGRLLGLPDEIIYRHPFPGPGLAARVVCNYHMPENFEKLKQDVSGIACEHGFQSSVLPIATVGVQGDNRTYRNLVLISGERDWDGMRGVRKAIVTSQPVNRIAFVLADNEPRRSFEIGINTETLDILRTADNLATIALKEYGLYDAVSQMPVVLFPDYENGRERGPAIGLRPVVTDDFMTARPTIPGRHVPWEYFDDVSQRIGELGVGKVVLDITDKPPGTIEWE